MYKLGAILLLVFAVYYTRCLPTDTGESDSEAATNSKFQLYVNNGSEAVNYHLTPVFDNLDTEDQQLNVELAAVLPYLNFLLGPGNSEEMGACLDQLEIQLIQEV